MTIEEICWFVDDTVTRALQGKPGIGRVDPLGGADREIRVELDPVKLDSFGVTARPRSAPRSRATNTNLGAGKISLGTGEQAIRTLGDQGTVDSLANTTIALPAGRFVKLTDLGQVIDSYEELKSFARINGEPTVVLRGLPLQGRLRGFVAETVNRRRWPSAAQAHPDVSIIKLVDDSVVLHLRQLRIRDAHADGRRAAGRPRRLPVPAQLARHADRRRRAAAVGDPDLLGDGSAGLLAEPGQPSWP
jgi:multidrug efflux pump subunit AcrB